MYIYRYILDRYEDPSHMSIYLHICLSVHIYICSFLHAVDGGIQSAFHNRLVALLLFNCPFQLTHLQIELEKEITSEFKGNNQTQYSYSDISVTSS